MAQPPTGNSETPTEQHLLRDVHAEAERLRSKAELLDELAEMDGAADPTSARRLLAEVAIQLARTQVVVEQAIGELRELTQAQLSANRIKAREIRTEHLRVEHEVEAEVERENAFAGAAASLAAFAGSIAKHQGVRIAVTGFITWVATWLYMHGWTLPAVPLPAP